MNAADIVFDLERRCAHFTLAEGIAKCRAKPGVLTDVDRQFFAGLTSYDHFADELHARMNERFWELPAAEQWVALRSTLSAGLGQAEPIAGWCHRLWLEYEAAYVAHLAKKQGVQ